MLPLSLVLPYNDYYEYFGPDFKLHILPSNMVNHNTKDQGTAAEESQRTHFRAQRPDATRTS